MSNKISFKGQIRIYIEWPIWLSILVVIFAGVMYFFDIKAGIVATIFAVVYVAVVLFLFFGNKKRVINDLISFATSYGQVQRQILRDFEIPYVLLDDSGKIIWSNDAFDHTMHMKKGYHKSISTLISEIDKTTLPSSVSETETFAHFENRDYRVSMKKVSMAQMLSQFEAVDFDESDGYLIACFMFDETSLNTVSRELDEQKLACGLIYLDNYDEALESVEEVRRSLLIALIDRKINKYFSNMDAIVKKLEKDKYLVVMQKKYLKSITENRFDILEDVKTVNIGNELAVTLSIGFGVETGSFIKNYEYARTAIDLALGRGGDQAIVKQPDEISYYGGKSQKTEKSTRVKARVKAHALREIIAGTDKIIIMGHKIIDVDAFGAAIGIYRIAKTFGKKVHIVVDDVTTSIKPLMDSVMSDDNHEENLFLSNMQAIEAVAAGTTLVVVDVNKPSFTECPELLKRCSSVVVLDHHRQGAEKIENATLSYIEPYASSASEMVAEILQYISDNVRLTAIEADCLYSGMMIDTNNFMTKTGVRTFEAAAYLRRNGADITRVRKLFRDDVSDYKARAEIVRNAEVFDESYAISVAPYIGSEVASPTVIGAQAANELLNINGIKASFVITEYQEQVYISARSIDEVNVQLIMERMGGGGHMNIAGAQLKDMTPDEAKNILLDVLEEMKREGAIE